MVFKKILIISLFLFLFSVFDIALAAPDPREYAPDLWFDSEEKYYPTNPLDFYYDENLNELSGEIAKQKYDNLNFNQKIDNLSVFYELKEAPTEYIYEYWLFYIFNEYKFNDHYGDAESVFVFIDKNDLKINRVVASMHNGSETKFVLANGEIKNPDENRYGILIEKGSHANWLDGNNDGMVNLFSDVDNWYNAFRIIDRSKDDVKNGFKINSHDYQLEPISKIRIKKELITKSPVLGFGKFKLGGKQRYLTKIGGYPPAAPWQKKIFDHPEEIRPITGKLVLEKIKESVASLANIFQGKKEARKTAIKNLDFVIKEKDIKPEVAVEELNDFDDTDDVNANANAREVAPQLPKKIFLPQETQIDIYKLRKELEFIKKQAKGIQTKIADLANSATSAVSLPSGLGHGGGQGSISNATSTPELINATSTEEKTIEVSDTTMPILTLGQNSYILTNATSTILSGTVSEDAILYVNFNNATSSQAINGNWSYTINLDNGSSSINLSAEDASGNKSDIIKVIIEVDTVAPMGEFAIMQSNEEEFWRFRLIGGTTATDLADIELWQSINNGVWQKMALQQTIYIPNSGTAFTHEIIAQPGEHHDIRIIFIDLAGNQNILARSADIALVSVNEIAWMGNASTTSAEWMELLNNSSSTIDLTGWTLRADDGVPDIDLSGELAAGEFMVLHRSSDYTGALENGGETLYLKDQNDWIMDYIDGEPWPAGDNSTKQTMERINFSDWQTSVLAGGTPGLANSSP